MPFIELQTNLPASKFSEDFLKKLCSTTAAALGKPEDRMNLVVKADLPMLIAGSCSPAVSLVVSAIAVTDTAEKNKEHSAKLFQFLTQELGLSQDRIVIRFYPLEPWQMMELPYFPNHKAHRIIGRIEEGIFKEVHVQEETFNEMPDFCAAYGLNQWD